VPPVMRIVFMNRLHVPVQGYYYALSPCERSIARGGL
jgi:hypothetical protein